MTNNIDRHCHQPAGDQSVPRPLIPVFEPLPETVAKAESHPHHSPHDPLVIGLGAAAEIIIDQVQTSPLLPADAGLYRTGNTASTHGADRLAQRLALCDSALLLIDTTDPQALADGRFWAQQLAEHEVSLRMAVLLNATDHVPPPDWRTTMQASLHGVIEVRTRRATLDAAATAQVLLHDLLFLQPVPMICCDANNVRQVLATGSPARATAVQWDHEDFLPIVVNHACVILDHPRCSGAIAWLHADDQLTIGEFNAFCDHLNRHLPQAALCIVASTPHPDWPEPQRILSLILVGDEDQTTGEL